MSDAGLTFKQQAFIREYLVCLNSAEAARRAGYSENSAASIGSENLSKPAIAEAIRLAMEERTERVEVTADTVVQGLLKEAMNAQSDTARVQAWAWIGKHLALFTDRSVVEFKGIAERIAAMSDDEVEALLAAGDDAIVAHLTAAGVPHAQA